MRSPCPSCGSRIYHRIRYGYFKGVREVECSSCSQIRMTPMYDDIYLGGRGGMQTDDNIRHPKTGEMIPFATKQDKAVAMKIAGVQQALSAERVHGFRNESHLNRKKYFEVS